MYLVYRICLFSNVFYNKLGIWKKSCFVYFKKWGEVGLFEESMFLKYSLLIKDYVG